MMKKLLLISSLFAFFAFTSYAQEDVRTVSTKIADALNQMPAENNTDFQTAMKEMESLGEDGLVQLAQRLDAPSDNGHAKEKYALMGYVSYVSASGKEALKTETEKALLDALSKTENEVNSIFLMDRLALIGTDASVPVLQKYLDQEKLGLKAAPTLAEIGTQRAGEALQNALSSSSNSNEYLIQALGDMKYANAAETISSFAKTGSSKEKEAAVYALSEIADPASAEVLAQQASSGEGAFSDKANTVAYGNFLENVAQQGNQEKAGELAQAFVQNSSGGSTLAKVAALNTLAKVTGEKAMPTLAKAAFSTDDVYRNAALNLAKKFLTEKKTPSLGLEEAALFTKGLKKAPPAVQASLVNFLADLDPGLLPKFVTKYAVKNSDKTLQNAAILAIAQKEGSDVTKNLLKVLDKNPDVAPEVIKEAFLINKDKGMTSEILKMLPKYKGKSRAVLIDVLAARMDQNAFDAIVGNVNDPDETVRKAAIAALPAVSGSGSLPQLIDLLQKADSEKEIKTLQSAITAVLKNNPEEENTVINSLNSADESRRYLYFPILKTIGSSTALSVLYKVYENNEEGKEEALQTLASWPDPNAMDLLSTIVEEGSGADKEAALTGYIDLIPKAEIPDEQKLLLYKKAMEKTSTKAQRVSILQEVSSINTFPALAFVAHYLEDKDLKSTAASSVLNIVSNNESLHGSTVKTWLEQAMKAIEGQDSPYFRKSIQKYLDEMKGEEGYVSLFNEKDLSGWKGLVGNPISRSEMSSQELEEAQKEADKVMEEGWTVENGELIFKGKGDNIATTKKYGNFEMLVDWKIFNDGQKDGDAGVYLRGTPQVQIWDTSRTDVGAEVGSGGLYNNQKNRSTPLKVADNPLGEWNHFYIKMIDDKVTVYLNGELVTDEVPLENYWDRNMPLWPEEQIELQAHGSRIGYRDIYIKELPTDKPMELSEEEKAEGFTALFNGKDLDNWVGNKTDYVVEGSEIVVRPQKGAHGNLYSEKEYGDFVLRFEFKLTPGANNGIGIRAPLEGDAAYVGMEIQVLDNTADIYKDLQKYQYHGSVYGVIPAKRGFLKPMGEWNTEEIRAEGNKIKVILNGTTIVDGDITDAQKNGTLDGRPHPGLKNKKGHIGFLGHGDVVHFRNLRIKEL